MTDGGGAGPAVSSEPDRGVGGRESGVSWASAMAAPPSSKSVRIACFIRVSAPSLQPELDRQKDPRRDGLCPPPRGLAAPLADCVGHRAIEVRVPGEISNWISPTRSSD